MHFLQMLKQRFSWIFSALSTKRWLLLLIGIAGLVAVYLLQNVQWAGLILGLHSESFLAFAVNKSLRFLLNDLFTLLIIFALFHQRSYMLFALYVQLFGMLLLLPGYLWIKYQFGDTYRSLDAHLHRVVMNPVLLMLLIPAFYLQKHHGTS